PDQDPLIFYGRIPSLASESLNPSGRLYFEINPRHAADMKRMVINSGFSDVEIIKDSFGKDRFLTAKKQAL
ncbi:MAG: peptide chain release factor N(5)-glutamine methyltransferase, partial [Muribaculaceae bacterium]|nr:peptide chain release factor N(5)-glutamine methyltransferase [Muribaculaceae bacterium]